LSRRSLEAIARTQQPLFKERGERQKVESDARRSRQLQLDSSALAGLVRLTRVYRLKDGGFYWPTRRSCVSPLERVRLHPDDLRTRGACCASEADRSRSSARNFDDRFIDAHWLPYCGRAAESSTVPRSSGQDEHGRTNHKQTIQRRPVRLDICMLCIEAECGGHCVRFC